MAVCYIRRQMINRKGRILFIHNAKFRNWKGTERFVFELGNFLIENGFEVNVIENSRAKRIMDAAPLDINIPFDIKAIKFKRIFGIDLVPKKEIKKLIRT